MILADIILGLNSVHRKNLRLLSKVVKKTGTKSYRGTSVAKRYDTFLIPYFFSFYYYSRHKYRTARNEVYLGDISNFFAQKYLLYRDKVTILFRIFPTKVNEVFFWKIERGLLPSFSIDLNSHPPISRKKKKKRKGKRRKKEREKKKGDNTKHNRKILILITTI